MAAMTQAMRLLTSKEKVEWYTPPEEIARVTDVLGWIDLDPASDAIGNATVKAACYYTKEQGGLHLPWYGRIFCNPPYNGAAGDWTDRFIAAYGYGAIQSGIVLINSCPGYAWWERAWRACWSCLVRDRIPFLQEDGTPLRDAKGRPIANKKGTTFLYLGPSPQRFVAAYRNHGRCFPPEV